MTIPAGRLAVFWAGIPHQIIASKNNTKYYVATIPLAWFLQCRFPADFVDAILRARVVLDPEPQIRGGDMEMFERWVHDFEQPDPQRQRISFLEIEARLFRFALAVPAGMALPRSSKAAHPIIPVGGLNRAERIALYIAQHYTEPLTAEQIAQSVGLHPNYAMSLFKKTMSITMVDCLTQHRVSHAQRLLATADDKIIDVALNSGFGSLSRFHDVFKRCCGCSPKEYRKQHRVEFT